MDVIKSESAKNILARSYDGGHICYENAEAAVEVAEKEMIQKATEAFRLFLPMKIHSAMDGANSIKRRLSVRMWPVKME